LNRGLTRLLILILGRVFNFIDLIEPP
jgi:hypothetical protein